MEEGIEYESHEEDEDFPDRVNNPQDYIAQSLLIFINSYLPVFRYNFCVYFMMILNDLVTRRNLKKCSLL